MKRPTPSVLVLISLTLAMVGCSDNTDRSETVITALEPHERWSIGGDPLLAIVPADDSASAEGLSHIVGVQRFPDGRIAVADASPRILIFGPDGDSVGSWGGPGDRPGEFLSVDWIEVLAPDTLMVFDGKNFRLTYFSGEGALVSTRDFRVRLIGRFADGSFAARSDAILSTDAPAMLRTTATIDRIDGEGQLIENLATLPAEEMYLAADGALVVAPYFRRLQTALGADRLHLAPGDRYEVLVRGKGANSRVVRADVPQPSYTEEQIESAVGRQIAELPAEARPSGPAATRNIVVDEDGNVWVETFPVDEGARGEWSVFDSEGALLAVVDTPSGFRPFEIDSDYAVGVWRGEAAVEEVRAYGIRRP